MKQVKKDGKIYVYSPFKSDAPKAFRNAGGEWKENAWIFPDADQDIVDSVCKSIYGVTGRESTAKAQIIVKDDISIYGESVIFAGFALSIARGRDSGARTGDGVKLMSGNIGSGGSVKNWTSRVEGGTIFRVDEFPVGIESTEKITVEYLEEVKTNAIQDDEIAMSAIKLLLSKGYAIETIEDALGTIVEALNTIAKS